MTSLLSRCVRLLMLALLVATPAWQPAAAQEEDSGPSVLRDSETELLFKDVSRPLIQAAGLSASSRLAGLIYEGSFAPGVLVTSAIAG